MVREETNVTEGAPFSSWSQINLVSEILESCDVQFYFTKIKKFLHILRRGKS